MNNKLTFTGGEPNMREDDFLRIQRANREFILQLFEDYGDCIIAGANGPQPTAGNPLILPDDGFVYLNGEVLKVDADSYPAGDPGWTAFKYVKVTTFEAGGDKTFLDGSPRQTWEKNRAVPTSVVSLGGGDLDAIDGQRYHKPLNDWTAVPFSANWIDQPGSTPTEYKKDQFGVVWVRGSFKKSIAGAGLATVFTLPVGFRPTEIEFLFIETSEVVTTTQMKDDGTFVISWPDHTTPAFFSFSFRTD